MAVDHSDSSSARAAGAGFKYYAKGHLVFLLIRQFKLLFEDLSVCVELDQAVGLDPGECSTAVQWHTSMPAFPCTDGCNHAASCSYIP